MKKFISFFPLLFTLILSSCNNNALLEKSFFSFSTIFTLKGYDIKENDFYKIEAMINSYSELFDAFNSYENLNNIYSINNTNEEIKIDEKLYEALKEANSYYLKTDKIFNPYIGELTFAYKKAYENFNETNELILPSKEFINKALNDINSFTLEFNDLNKSVKRIGNAKLDLGAFAKGYTIDKIKHLSNELGIKHYLLNGGNSSSYFTSNIENKPFKAGIKYLDKKAINIKDASLGISSIFEQYIEYDKKIYSHIINPFNGRSESYYDFSIVKHESALITDIFSTVLMLIKDKEKIDLFKDEFNFDYLLYKDNIEIYSSGGINLISY